MEWIVILILFFFLRYFLGNLFWVWRRFRCYFWWSIYRWIWCSFFILFGGFYVDCGFNCWWSYLILYFEIKGKYEKGSKGICGIYNEYNEINVFKVL